MFGLCGDHTNPLFEACADAGIRIVDSRDERGAAWMAAGWALATAEPGVVMVSNTPALTNAATALADSDASGIPVLCITGGVGMDERGRGHPGDQDQIAIARPWSRWAERVDDPNLVSDATQRALRAARPTAGRPGVAVLELPLDVQHRAADRPLSARAQPIRSEPDNLAGARAALGRATKPVIVAGSGCWWARAGEALHALVGRARIPVFTSRAARGLIPDDHEYCMGFPNLMTPAAQLAFGEADVALVVGSKLDLMLGNGAFQPACTVIRIDADPDAFAVGRPAEIEIRGDARAALERLADGAEELPTKEWVTRLREATDARAEQVAGRGQIASSPLHPGRLVAEVAAKLPRNAVVCADAGEFALWAIDAVPALGPSSFHSSSGSALGALGMGLPWAIGMKLARPDRPVLVLAGDGSFGFTALEVETAARHRAPVAVVVGNDAGWGIVRHLQQTLHGRALASDLPRSPYEILAEFAGGVGDVVRTPQQAAIAITNALVAPVPSVVNAIIDPAARHEAIELIAAMFRARGG